MRARLACVLPFVAFSACGPDAPDVGWEEEPGAGDRGWLLSVWAPPSGPRYLVGGTPEAGVVFTDGSGEYAAIPDLPDVPLLNWVYGVSRDDVFVVGDEGTVLHFDGASWETQPTPTTEPLWGVWGATGDDVWAVGGRGQSSSVATILHYDGETWVDVPAPTLSRPGVTAFFKVWGSGSEDVFVVGRFGAILHYDGEVWTEQASGTADDLISVWGTGPDRVVAVGGRSNARLVVYDGERWSSLALEPLPGLNGVFIRTPDVAHVVGIEGTVARVDLAALTFREEYPATQMDFHAVFATDTGALTAVGGNFTAAPGEEAGIVFVRGLRDDE